MNQKQQKTAWAKAHPTEFLKISERRLLKDAGKVSAEQAALKAQQEFEKYRKERDKNYISDFDMAVKKYLQKGKKKN